MKMVIGKKLAGQEIDKVSESEFMESGVKNELPLHMAEIKNRRGRRSKIFSDGSQKMKAEFYGNPVHFYDEDKGEYKEIDNRFDDNGEVFETRKNTFKSKFHKHLQNGKVFEMEKDLCSIGLKSLDAARCGVCHMEVCECAEGVCDCNKVLVKDVAENTDIEYVVDSERIKENIIVKERAEKYEYDFDLSLDNLAVGVSSDGKSLELTKKDTGKLEFYIPAPVMFDANGESSEEVYYEIEQDALESLKIKVIANADWINADGRAFPVTIDPQVVAATFKGAYSYYSTDYNDSVFRYRTLQDGKVVGYELRAFLEDDFKKALTSEIIISKNKLPRQAINSKNLIKATVKFTIKPNSKIDFFTVNGELYNSCEKYTNILVDITSELLEKGNEVIINVSPFFYKQFYPCDIYFTAPVLELEYNNFVTGLSVRKQAEKLNYVSGERFVPDGMVVEAIYENGNRKTLANNEYTYSPAGELSSDDKRITIICKDNPDVCCAYDIIVGENENEAETRTFALAGGATGSMNMATGEFAASFTDINAGSSVLPLSIARVYLNGNGIFHQGKRWQLNLNQQLEILGDDYYYIDGTGREHKFKEVYYYVKDYKRITISKYDVNVSPNGFLTCTVDGKTYEVTRELRTNEGLRLVTRLENADYFGYFEQRQEEEKQLEEYVDTYEKNLDEFYVVNKSNFTDKEKLDYSSPKSVQGFLSKSNVYNHAIITKSVLQQIKSLRCSAAASSNDNLKNDYKAQEECIWEQARYNEDTVTKLYKEYVTKKEQLEQLKRQLPVAYLIGEDGTMLCFNTKNKLCAIADRYENVISIEWGDAVINGSVREAITAVYDGERKTTLKYNCFGQLISVTDPDGNSAKYTYEGTEGNSALIKTVYSNGKMLYFTYCADGLSYVRCNDHTLTKITYLNGIPAEITTYSTVDGITDETQPVSEVYIYQTPYEGAKIISSVKIAYSADRVCIEEDGTSEYILKNGNGKTSGGYTVKNGKASGLTLYTRAERQYEITVMPKKRTEIKNPNAGMDNTVKKYLNSPPVIATLPYAAEEYRDYSEADWEFTELDKFNRPKFVNTNWRKTYTTDTGKDVYKKTAVTYEYAAGSSEYNCIKKTTREYTKYDGNNSTGGEEMRVYAEEYSYCEHGNLVKTESYAEGEEGTSGVTVTEKVCDEKGNIIKQFTYNTLDSSTRFYTENEYADNGKVTAEADETGGNKTKLIYNGGTDRVNTRVLPNGGKISYGYDESGNVTSVTQSTEDGEENSTNIKYTLNCPTRLTSGNNVVYYEYDYKRRPTKVTVNGTTTEYAYDDENGITAATFAGHTFTTKKNKDGNVIKTEADGAVQLEYTYANGLLKSIDDNVTGETANYEYNVNKAVSKISSAEITEVYNYNDRNEIISKAYGGAISQVYGYTYRNNAARDIEYITMPNGLSSYPLKDVNGRNTGKELYNGENKVYGEYISYRKVGDHATNMPSAIWYANGKEIKDNIKYKYDSCGNISEICENGRLSVRYKYDSLNRLVREDNKKFNKTWLYTYDNCGNITSKREAGFTLKPEAEITEYIKENVYGYEGDRLVSKNGEAIEYDSKGNIKKIGNNVLRWWKGKRLESYGQTEFGYDGYGRRETKVHPLEGTTEYIYDSEGRLIKQNGKNTLEYIYDERGVSGFNYNGKEYIYRKNAQGDVTQIKELSGEAIVEYIYDAWGNCEIMGDREIGKINPYRYRSYYYDESTGLYYLQTRYYSPALGRFISQDDVSYLDPETINGLNLYAYCFNNPVMGCDPSGTEVKWWQWLIAGVVAVASIALAVVTMGVGLTIAATITGAIVGGAYGGITAAMNGQNIGEGIGIGVLAGISLGNISASFSYMSAKGIMNPVVALVANFGTSAAVGVGAEVLSQISNSNKVTNWENVAISAFQWGVLNSLNFGLGYLAEINFGNAIVGGYTFNVMTGVIGFIIDLIKSDKLINRRRVS